MLGQLRFWLGTRRRAFDQRRRQQVWRRFYAQFVRPDDLCFDVGASIGDRTQLFLQLGARVVAVEPQLRCQATLRSTYGSDRRFTLVPAALGTTAGEAEIRRPTGGSAIASLSPEWIESVRATRRFGDSEWGEAEAVTVTTLDALIADHGLPAFAKIDVEGFELEVLRGLRSAIPALSFEFTPEHLDVALGCIERLTVLGMYEFNYALGEEPILRLPNWIPPDEMRAQLEALRCEDRLFGDVYARLTLETDSSAN